MLVHFQSDSILDKLQNCNDLSALKVLLVIKDGAACIEVYFSSSEVIHLITEQTSINMVDFVYPLPIEWIFQLLVDNVTTLNLRINKNCISVVI